MTTTYHAIRNVKHNSTFQKGDVLVLFGELFSRGYANGLVEEAERRGMKIIRATVGRREKDGSLRPLNQEELAAHPSPLINIPLEAGFDLEPNLKGISPVDQLKDIKLSEWESAKLDKEGWLESQKKGRERFQKNLKLYVQELEKHVPPNANVLFAHLMAGGVPRAKIIMPLMNRSVKGTGDRFLSSEKFWNSEIGQLCAQSFNDVTAETFNLLVQETTQFRKQIQDKGHKVSYIAYGYHGTEVLIGHNYLWQTYTPYLQGWAKKRLESYSAEWAKHGVTCAVYNCPEILTNSSSIFAGVEVSLYPLLKALVKEAPEKAGAVVDKCQSLLKPGLTLDNLLEVTNQYLSSDTTRSHCQFNKWPQHNEQAQLENMLKSSDHLIEMHQDQKNLITFILSEIVFKSCGQVMINDAPHPESPVAWINHDIVAKWFNEQ
ncbi:MAG: hypothetical protein BroJett040_24020 [Oligoflexia bacterium]|nr:MAG: hypothetical protein BroJett040_24020 [Oligoflexia bacterium]